MADLKAFAEQLVGLTVKEVNELAKILKEEYGIEPAAAAVAVAAGPAAGGGAAAAEEKTAFNVILKAAGGALRVHALRNAYDELHARDPKAYPRTARTAYQFDPKEWLRLNLALDEASGK